MFSQRPQLPDQQRPEPASRRFSGIRKPSRDAKSGLGWKPAIAKTVGGLLMAGLGAWIIQSGIGPEGGGLLRTIRPGLIIGIVLILAGVANLLSGLLWLAKASLRRLLRRTPPE
jgi:hypothetical protein